MAKVVAAPKIQVKNLQKELHKAVIMDGLTLTVHEGEIFALVGEPGSGKTLLAKIMMRLVKKTGGEVQFDGSVGSVIESQNFYNDKTGVGTIKHCAALQSRPVPRSRIVNVMNLLGLRKVMNWTIDRYSPSQIARLKIAVALVTRPEILVLDEPFDSLTPVEARDIRIILKTIADNHGTAVMITSATLEGVEEICDTIGIIDDGMIVTIKSYNQMVNDDAPATKISVFTKTPNYTAQIIERELKYETHLCGNLVIVNAPPSNAQSIANALHENNIKVLSMQRVNRSLQEQYYEIVRNRSIFNIGSRGGV